MNNGKPQIIIKSDFKQHFQYVVSPETFSKHCLSSVLLLHSSPQKKQHNLFCQESQFNFYMFCFFSGKLSSDAETPKGRSNRKRKTKRLKPVIPTHYVHGADDLITLPSAGHADAFFPQWLNIPAKSN